MKLSETTEMRQNEAEYEVRAKVFDTIACGKHLDTPTITLFVTPHNLFKCKNDVSILVNFQHSYIMEFHDKDSNNIKTTINL